MRKWTFEFLNKSESKDNKVTRLNSIRSAKSINLLSFRTNVGVPCDVYILKLTTDAKSIYREVYGPANQIIIMRPYRRINN